MRLFSGLQRPGGVKYGQDHDAYIGKDGRLHPCDALGSQDQTDSLDTQGKDDVFVYDAKAFAGNTHGQSDLCRIVVHQHDVSGFYGSVAAHGAHGDTDIGPGQNRSVIDAVACESKSSAGLFLRQKALDLVYLIRRQQFTVDLVDAQSPGDGVRHGGGIAGVLLP